jgi:hypothetical protein
MVKSCVFFAARTEFLNMILTGFGFKGLTKDKIFLTRITKADFSGSAA